MFVFLFCLAALTLHCEAGGIYGIVSPGPYTNYNGVYAAGYKNYKPYGFEYGVSDPHTGDYKRQWETKDEHGTVRGSYSLLEPDGSTRVVDYIADDHGFRAIVKKIGIHGASVESHGGAVEAPALSATPIIAAEPALTHVAQPVVFKQEEPLLVKQPAVYLEQGPTFHSYDGGYEDYQNLVPYSVPKAQGLAAPVALPKPAITYTPKYEAAALPTYVAPKEPIYIKQDVLAPKAEGLYLSQPGYAIPELPQTYHQTPVAYNQVPIAYQKPIAYEVPESYQAPAAYQAPTAYQASTAYQAPAEYQAPAAYEAPVAYKSPAAYEAPVAYRAPVAYNQPEVKSYQTIQKYPVEQKLAVAAPAYETNLPNDNYQFEQTFGEPVQTGHFVAGPHGESSQSYYGTTGNLQDDYQYSNYDQGYKQPQPYSKW